MNSRKLFKIIKQDIETHVNTIGFGGDRGTIPIINLSALLLRFQAICEGKSMKDAIKIQDNYMEQNKE